MEKEYSMVRKTMLEQIRLTPFNPDKTLRLIIYRASTEGVGIVLFHTKTERVGCTFGMSILCIVDSSPGFRNNFAE